LATTASFGVSNGSEFYLASVTAHEIIMGANGETMMDIARSMNVSHSTISRIKIYVEKATPVKISPLRY